MRKIAVLAALTALVTALTISQAASAQNNSQQTGLVNVSLGDVNLLNNVNLAVAANVAATVCGVTVPIAVLAQQVVAADGFTCETATEDLTIEQALNGGPGAFPPNGGGNNSQQTGLVNVSLGDVNVLNDANLAIAANIAATACGIAVPVAVLAQQLVATGEFECATATEPLTITQGQ